MIGRILAGAVLASVLTASATAQTAPAPPPPPAPPQFYAPPSVPLPGSPFAGRPEYSRDFMLSQNWRDNSLAEYRAARQRTRKILADAGPQRVGYARQVADLLNGGKCAEARAFALSKGEQDMAGKAVVYCRMRYGRTS